MRYVLAKFSTREQTMTDNLQDLISTKLAAAIANPLFPAVDSQLRAGRHISLDQLDNHAF